MKKVGLAAFEFEDKKTAFQSLSENFQQSNIEQLNTQLEVFQNALTYFATEHADEIRTNPKFRSEFARMCTAIGIDPLASSSSNKKSGSLFANVLGKDINDFYFELAVRIIEICRLTRDANGGLIGVNEVITRLKSSKTLLKPADVTIDDVERAVESCKDLGSGLALVTYGGEKMIRSLPNELNNNQATVLEACQAMGYVSVSILRDNFNWNRVRSETTLDDMVSAGLLWVDDQGIEREYWTPQWIDVVD